MPFESFIWVGHRSRSQVLDDFSLDNLLVYDDVNFAKYCFTQTIVTKDLPLHCQNAVVWMVAVRQWN